MSHISVSLLLLLSACAVAIGQSPPRPACEVLLLDGRVLPADRIVGPEGAVVRITAGEHEQVVPAADVLSVHGAGVSVNPLPAAGLAGGDVVRGLIVGGDAAGNQLDLQSPVLGHQRIAVDRLESLLLRPDLARAADLVLPEGQDEALFVAAALGFDRIVGTLHQFGEPGIRFQPTGQPEPHWYPARELIGLRLRGGSGPGQATVAEVCTRSGDRVGARAFAFTGAELQVTLENGSTCKLALSDLACLSRLDRGVVFASSLTPSAIAEAAHDGLVLLPWQRDAAVTGGPMLAAGRCYGRGFGVHSRSRLEFEVPAGVVAFAAMVAFDDSVLPLPIRGEADVFVRVDEAVPFAHKGLRAGAAPLSIGPVPVRPGQRLSLEVEFGVGRDLGDRIDWLMPRFLPATASAAAK